MPAHWMLHRAKILDLLSESDIEGLHVLGEERSFEMGAPLSRAEEAVDSLFILLEGQVRACIIERGQELEFQHYKPGDHFAQTALVDGQLCRVRLTGFTRGRVFILPSKGSTALLSRVSRGRPLIPKFTPATPMQRPRSAEPRPPEPRAPEAPTTPPPTSGGDLMHIRSLSSAVAGVAHEINTPLGVIGNAASFVAEQLTPDNLGALQLSPAAAETLGDIAEACHLIQKNVAHAARLVQSFKKLSVGQLAEPRERVDLVRLVQEVLNVFRAKTISALPPAPNYRGLGSKSGQHRLILASSRLEIQIRCSLSPEERTWDGFPGLFSRVLLNLLTNIDRYAYPDDAPGDVEIQIKATKLAGAPAFELLVRDFGRGIPPSDLPHIFDPFFTTGRDKGGTGLGLAMVHNLVTQGFSGTVRATSVEGEGTTFELCFPIRAPDHASVMNQSLEPHHRLLDPKFR